MEKEKTSMINKENISDYAARSVMITAMEGDVSRARAILADSL